MKNTVIPAILALTRQETPNDNLLASACLELFEYLRLNPASRIILNELMSKHEDEVKALSAGLPVFQGLITKWEQLNEAPPQADVTSSEAETVADASKDPIDAPSVSFNSMNEAVAEQSSPAVSPIVTVTIAP